MLTDTRRQCPRVRRKGSRRRSNATLKITLLTEGFQWREIWAIRCAGA
jgi:hypothetical protein